GKGRATCGGSNPPHPNPSPPEAGGEGLLCLLPLPASGGEGLGGGVKAPGAGVSARSSRSDPSRSRAGQRRATASTTSRAPTPPPTPDGTAPNQWAVSPDSNSPSSLDELMNTTLIAATRPRISSGVSVCISVPRTTTLMLSSAPAASSATKDSQGFA